MDGMTNRETSHSGQMNQWLVRLLIFSMNREEPIESCGRYMETCHSTELNKQCTARLWRISDVISVPEGVVVQERTPVDSPA